MEGSKSRETLGRHCTLNIHLIRFIAESDRSAVAVDVVIVRRVSRIVACKDTAQCL